MAFLGFTQAGAALRDGSARSVLARAEAMPRGMERDAALAQAIIVIDDAVKAAPQNSGVHARAARAYYLQATTAAVDDVSAPLLGAARRAAEESLKHSPANASAAAMSALVDIAEGGVVTPGAVDAVARSYAVPATAEGVRWRFDAAMRAWPALSLPLQRQVIVDACMQADADRAFAAHLADVAARLPDSGLGQCGAPEAASDAAP
ncbi:MAG: hypothetical protein IV086_11440 [Hyphomonadaceae bacterium]|nr:MAG: hypothetical protein FD160_893 [Caulobacteraceae bacterium]MBT9446303.1 hypothetical protein [Hyphomonadaceae bacterium]